MGKNVKLTSTRGLIAIILSLSLVYLFVSNTTQHITEYITMYMVIINYLFGNHDNNGDSDK